MELLNAQTSHRLEWIIIIVRFSFRSVENKRPLADLFTLPQLIAFEISLVLYREGLPFVKSSSEEGEKKKSSH